MKRKRKKKQRKTLKKKRSKARNRRNKRPRAMNLQQILGFKFKTFIKTYEDFKKKRKTEKSKLDKLT